MSDGRASLDCDEHFSAMGQTSLPPGYQAGGPMRLWDTWDSWSLHLPCVLSGSPDCSKQLTEGPRAYPLGLPSDCSSLRLSVWGSALSLDSVSACLCPPQLSPLPPSTSDGTCSVSVVDDSSGVVCSGRFVTGGSHQGGLGSCSKNNTPHGTKQTALCYPECSQIGIELLGQRATV